MTGWLAIAGLGPGAAQLVTPEVTGALAQATDLIGYAPYVARVPARAGLTRHGSDNREELDRASLALRLAAAGKRVVVVSSGDPGVFAMAAAVFEAIDAGDPSWRDLDIRVLPGISAMFAAAAALPEAPSRRRENAAISNGATIMRFISCFPECFQRLFRLRR